MIAFVASARPICRIRASSPLHHTSRSMSVTSSCSLDAARCSISPASMWTTDPRSTGSRRTSSCPASTRERSRRSVESFASRCTCPCIVSMKPRRVSSSRSSSARSSRNPPIENRGVRSSCDAFATNSFRALSSCASWTRIWSNARASSPISSLPWSTIGAPKSPPAIRSAAVSSRRSRCESIPAAVSPRTSASTRAKAVASSNRSRTSRTVASESASGAWKSTTASSPSGTATFA